MARRPRCPGLARTCAEPAQVGSNPPLACSGSVLFLTRERSSTEVVRNPPDLPQGEAYLAGRADISRRTRSSRPGGGSQRTVRAGCWSGWRASGGSRPATPATEFGATAPGGRRPQGRCSPLHLPTPRSSSSRLGRGRHCGRRTSAFGRRHSVGVVSGLVAVRRRSPGRPQHRPHLG